MVRLFPEQAVALVTLVRGLLPPDQTPPQVADALDVIDQQVNSPNHAADVLDTVAKLLEQNRQHNLTGRMLTALRNAVLSPTELAKVRAMESTHTACTICSRELHEGEVVALVGANIVCYRCAMPHIVTCAGCNHSLPVPGVARVIQKIVKACEHCKRGEKHVDEFAPKQINDPWNEPQVVPARGLRLGDLARQAGTAVRDNRVPAPAPTPPAIADAFQQAMRRADEQMEARVFRHAADDLAAGAAQPNQWITFTNEPTTITFQGPEIEVPLDWRVNVAQTREDGDEG